jgi:hypothetical protein
MEWTQGMEDARARAARSGRGRTNVETDLPDFAAQMEAIAAAKAAAAKEREARMRRAEIARGQKFLTNSLEKKGYFTAKGESMKRYATDNVLHNKGMAADADRINMAMKWYKSKEDVRDEPNMESQKAAQGN